MLSKYTLKATKLTPPKRSGALIIRNNLLETLYRSRNKRLLLLDAPAGYGKTNLQTQFYNQLSHNNIKTCWISCETGDDDKINFLAYLIEAISKVIPGFGSETRSIISNALNLPGDAFDAIIINEIAQLKTDIYVFIDDYHLLSCDNIRKLLNSLLIETLPKIHFCLSTRDKAGLPLYKLRVNDELEHLTLEKLQFNNSETLDFLIAGNNENITKDLAQDLCIKTEGWVAALQLASIALTSKKNAKNWISSFSGNDKNLGEFLAKEVFDEQSSNIQDFLLKTSVLKKFNAGLSAFITGDNDAQECIRVLDEKNLFLFSLDSDGEWYRYHHFFSDFLFKLLKTESPRIISTLHVKAYEWLHANKMINDALYHAFEAEDYSRAAELLDRASAQLFATGHTYRLESYAERLPIELIKTLPHLQLDRAWNYDLVLKFDKAREALDDVHEYLKECDPESLCHQDITSTLAHREMFLKFRQDDVVTSLKEAENWLNNNSTEDPFKCASTATIILACKKELYDTDDIAIDLPILHSLCLKGSALYGAVFLDSFCGAALFMRGELNEALKILYRGRERAIELHGELSALASMPTVNIAEVFCTRIIRFPKQRNS